MPRKGQSRAPAPSISMGKPNLKLEDQRSRNITNSSKRADPTSPPDTPTNSPLQVRKHAAQPLHRAQLSAPAIKNVPQIRPIGTGHQFSYQPFGTEQLSPRSTSSDESESESESESEDDVAVNQRSMAFRGRTDHHYDGEDEAEDIESSSDEEEDADSVMASDRDDMEEDDDEEEEEEEEEEEDDDEDNEEAVHDAHNVGDKADQMELEPPQLLGTASFTQMAVVCNFTLEDIDSLASDCDGLDVLQPTEIESNRSRSRSRLRHKDLPIRIISDLRNLNCSNEVSDNSPPASPHASAVADAESEELFNRWQQEMRRRRVSVSSSIGKRTHSELSDDSDFGEDGGLDVNDVGFSARRMRKRLHRGSLLFQDPPEPRIDELEEPSSGEDERVANQSLAMELPYWTMEIMEVDSSS